MISTKDNNILEKSKFDMIINMNGQLKYINLTYKYWNQFKAINKAKLIITTEQYAHLKNGEQIEITQEYLDKLGLNYDKLTIFSKEQTLKMKNDVDVQYEKIKPYFNKLEPGYMYRALMRWKHFEFFLKNNTEYQLDNVKIAFMRSDFLLGNINKEKNDIPLEIYDDIIFPSKISHMENIRISDYFFFGDYNSCKILNDTILKKYGYFIDDIKSIQLEESEGQINQLVNLLRAFSSTKFVDIRDFENNLFSFNFLYSKDHLSIRKSGDKKDNKIYGDALVDKNNLVHNFYGIQYFPHMEIWTRKRTNNPNERKFINFPEYQTLLEYIKKSNDLQNIYVKNDKIKLNQNNIIQLYDLHRVNYDNFKRFIQDTDTSIIYSIYLPYWFINLFNDLFGSNRPRLVFFPKYLWSHTCGPQGRDMYLWNVLKDPYNNPKLSKNMYKPIDILIYGNYKSKIKPDKTTRMYLSNESHVNLDFYYELRYRLFTTILKDERLKGLNIKFVHGGRGHIPFHEIFSLINQSKFTIATCSNVLYLLKKYYEIPLNNSIIIGNIPTYAPQKMKENIINIKNSMTDDEIVEILIDSVKNYEKHKPKLLLGSYLYEMSKIISELDYLRDTYIYHHSGVKTKRLEKFEKEFLYDQIISNKYDNEY